MKFSLIIPAKNEEKRIILPLLEYYAALHRRFGANKFEILVVVNNTSDNTVKVLRTIKRTLKANEIKIHNIGLAEAKGRAVIHGMYHAKGKYIGFTDADGSYSPREVLRLYRQLVLSQAEAIIPDRYSTKSHLIGALPLSRRIFSRIFNFTVKTLFMIKNNDTQGGLKIFRKKALKAILPEVSTFGWTFDLNVILALKNNNFTIFETPITWSQKEGSKLNPLGTLLTVAREVGKLAFKQYIYRPFIAISQARE